MLVMPNLSVFPSWITCNLSASNFCCICTCSRLRSAHLVHLIPYHSGTKLRPQSLHGFRFSFSHSANCISGLFRHSISCPPVKHLRHILCLLENVTSLSIGCPQITHSFILYLFIQTAHRLRGHGLSDKNPIFPECWRFYRADCKTYHRSAMYTPNPHSCAGMGVIR